MTDDPTPAPENTTPPAAPEETPEPAAETSSATPPPVPGIRQSVRAGASRAKADAQEAAKTALPLAKKAAGLAAFGGAYAIAYGATFVFNVAKQIIPRPIKDAIKKGASAAGDDTRPAAAVDPTAPVGGTA